MTDNDILEMLPASYSEIAERFGISENMAKNAITRLRRKHNIRGVGKFGKNPDFRLELVPPPVKLPQTWTSRDYHAERRLTVDA